jgi:hypothetical protein
LWLTEYIISNNTAVDNNLNMSILRIIHSNAADRAVITASSTAGTLVAANMQTDLKGQIHRSTASSVSYSLLWPSFESIGGVALPACNLSSSATIRVRGYSDAAGAVLAVDTGVQYACPGANIDMWDWAIPLNGNAFAFGGATKALCWLDSHYALRYMIIDIADISNSAGYVDCSRLVTGAYWSPVKNAAYGVTNSVDDGSKNSRNDAGDLQTDRFPSSDNLKFDLKFMPTTDRARINQIMRSVGVSRPLFVSLYPDADDPLLQQDVMIYGKRQNSSLSFAGMNYYDTSLTIEGW